MAEIEGNMGLWLVIQLTIKFLSTVDDSETTQDNVKQFWKLLDLHGSNEEMTI